MSTASFKLPVIWRFFVLAVGLSWLFWIPAALLPAAEPDLRVTILHYLGGAMPFATTLLALFTWGDAAVRRDYWQRLVRVRGGMLGWLAVSLLIPPLVIAMSALIDRALGGQGAYPEAVARFSGQPLAIIPFALFMLLFGPLPEELAWRGYGQHQMQWHCAPFLAALLIGAVWAVWHLPLYFIEGSFQYNLGFGSAYFWQFTLALLPQSVVIAWLYNRAEHRTLSAVLFHFSTNFTGELTTLTARADWVAFALWFVAAGIAVVLWGSAAWRRTLAHDSGSLLKAA